MACACKTEQCTHVVVVMTLQVSDRNSLMSLEPCSDLGNRQAQHLHRGGGCKQTPVSSSSSGASQRRVAELAAI